MMNTLWIGLILNGNKITEVVWSRRLKEFICDRDDFVFYAIWYLEPVK